MMYFCLYAFSLFLFMVVSLTFFKSKEKNSNVWNGLKLLSFTYWILTLYELFFKKTYINDHIEMLSSVVCFASILLYIWTYFTVREKKFGLAFNKENATEIVTSGPFKYIRHPFYTSYLLSYFSYFIHSLSFFSFFSFMSFLFIYYKASTDEEEVILMSSVHVQYSGYQKKTGRFIPFL